jgi:hypothetical protein
MCGTSTGFPKPTPAILTFAWDSAPDFRDPPSVRHLHSVNVAIVHDWLTSLGGAELVLRELLRIYPHARVFTLVDKMASEDRRFLGVERVSTSLLDSLPGVARHYRSMLPLFPLAMR